MARSFHQSLLAAVVTLVVSGSAFAQNTLQDAVNLLRVDKKTEAVEKLREIIQGDPSNEAAHDLYQSISQDEWYMLMTEQGEVTKIARSILESAKTTRSDRSRDEAEIAALVETATDASLDYGARQQARNKLVTEHGEFAVPALVEMLGDSDDAEGQIQAISTLSQLHSVAVLPLIEVLMSSNDLAVQNAAAALKLIGDARALPIMVHLANDDRANIAMIAKKFVEAHGGGDAVEMLLAQSNGYLKGIVPVGGFSDVVWTLDGDKLVATDVPALLYPSELAKSSASAAVNIAPRSLNALSALAAANLAQANLIEASIAQGDESTAEMGPVAQELKIAAIAAGVDALRGALAAGVEQGIAPVAIGAIDALADAEIIDMIDESTLLGALNASDKRIKYAAAEAIVRASRGSNVPSLAGVVGVLAQAVTEEKVNTIHVIAPESGARGAAQTASSVRGQFFTQDASAVGGQLTLLRNPSIDVVVISEILPDALPEDVIGNIRKDARMANTKIVIVTKDEDAAAERFGDEVSFIAAPLTADGLQAGVAAALEGAENPAGARAEDYASKASAALLNLASRKADISSAMDNLALQLNRGDSVAVPAAAAIGLSGGAAQMDALLGALAGGSPELKHAAAHAVGNLLSRMDGCPANVTAALMAALDEDSVKIRMAVATAFSKAKIDAETKLKLMQKLSRVAGSSSEG
jgi:HEAT repeat protein